MVRRATRTDRSKSWPSITVRFCPIGVPVANLHAAADAVGLLDAEVGDGGDRRRRALAPISWRLRSRNTVDRSGAPKKRLAPRKTRPTCWSRLSLADTPGVAPTPNRFRRSRSAARPKRCSRIGRHHVVVVARGRSGTGTADARGAGSARPRAASSARRGGTALGGRGADHRLQIRSPRRDTRRCRRAAVASARAPRIDRRSRRQRDGPRDERLARIGALDDDVPQDRAGARIDAEGDVHLARKRIDAGRRRRPVRRGSLPGGTAVERDPTFADELSPIRRA